MKKTVLALALVGFTYGAFANVQVPAKSIKGTTHQTAKTDSVKKKSVKKVKSAAEKPAAKKM